jgi:hypothetical protein
VPPAAPANCGREIRAGLAKTGVKGGAGGFFGRARDGHPMMSAAFSPINLSLCIVAAHDLLKVHIKKD